MIKDRSIEIIRLTLYRASILVRLREVSLFFYSKPEEKISKDWMWLSMYIERIVIEGYGAFKEETEIQFNEGLNVLIVANNCGKSTVMNALRLLFERDSPKRLDIADFERTPYITIYQETPPQVTIKLIFKEEDNKDNPYSDEIVTVSDWLIEIDRPFKAQLTY